MSDTDEQEMTADTPSGGTPSGASPSDGASSDAPSKDAPSSDVPVLADTEVPDFDAPSAQADSAFIVDLDGFGGPIDLLLTLARNQKVDITQISIVQLADQYLEFVADARRTNLELAADYLVMAAWLAYLKSKLLIPDLSTGDEPSGAEMAAALAFQLKRLEVMQQSGAKIMARSRRGQDFFARGMPERFATDTKTIYEVGLYDLLKAYGTGTTRYTGEKVLHIEPWELFTVEESINRLRSLLGTVPDWQELSQFLPQGLRDPFARRSAMASTFAATLELAKAGKLDLRQTETFGPIQLRSADRTDDDDSQDRNDMVDDREDISPESIEPT